MPRRSTHRQRGQRRQRLQGGMTLVEMMVVIVIIGVLTGLALILLRGRPGLQETCHQLANQVREASRNAVARGVVDQVLVDSGDPAPSARARVAIAFDAGFDRQVVTVEVRDETTDPDQWLIYSTHYLRSGILIFGYAEELVINPPLVGTLETLDSQEGAGANPRADLYFNPDGSMVVGAARPQTLFVRNTGTQQQRQMRVVVMPLQGQPLVFSGW